MTTCSERVYSPDLSGQHSWHFIGAIATISNNDHLLTSRLGKADHRLAFIKCMETVILGNTKIETSILSIGTGSNGWNGKSDQTTLGIRGLSDLLLYAYDQKITFWDTADAYGSHPHLKVALKNVDRSSVVIASKTLAQTENSVRKDLDRFLLELGTDYIDILLLHCLTSANWIDHYRSAMDALSLCKEKGLIKAHGVSCHNFGAFKVAAQSDWVEIVLARINRAGICMDESLTKVIKVLDQMATEGKGVYGMKVMGMGDLAREDAQKSIEFVLDLPAVHAVTIGMMSREELDANVEIIQNYCNRKK